MKIDQRTAQQIENAFIGQNLILIPQTDCWFVHTESGKEAAHSVKNRIIKIAESIKLCAIIGLNKEEEICFTVFPFKCEQIVRKIDDEETLNIAFVCSASPDVIKV